MEASFTDSATPGAEPQGTHGGGGSNPGASFDQNATGTSTVMGHGSPSVNAGASARRKPSIKEAWEDKHGTPMEHSPNYKRAGPPINKGPKTLKNLAETIKPIGKTTWANKLNSPRNKMRASAATPKHTNNKSPGGSKPGSPYLGEFILDAINRQQENEIMLSSYNEDESDEAANKTDTEAMKLLNEDSAGEQVLYEAPCANSTQLQQQQSRKKTGKGKYQTPPQKHYERKMSTVNVNYNNKIEPEKEKPKKKQLKEWQSETTGSEEELGTKYETTKQGKGKKGYITESENETRRKSKYEKYKKSKYQEGNTTDETNRDSSDSESDSPGFAGEKDHKGRKQVFKNRSEKRKERSRERMAAFNESKIRESQEQKRRMQKQKQQEREKKELEKKKQKHYRSISSSNLPPKKKHRSEHEEYVDDSEPTSKPKENQKKGKKNDQDEHIKNSEPAPREHQRKGKKEHIQQKTSHEQRNIQNTKQNNAERKEKKKRTYAEAIIEENKAVILHRNRPLVADDFLYIQSRMFEFLEQKDKQCKWRPKVIKVSLREGSIVLYCASQQDAEQFAYIMPHLKPKEGKAGDLMVLNNDEANGIYNFHCRVSDPEIGRDPAKIKQRLLEYNESLRTHYFAVTGFINTPKDKNGATFKVRGDFGFFQEIRKVSMSPFYGCVRADFWPSTKSSIALMQQYGEQMEVDREEEDGEEQDGDQ